MLRKTATVAALCALAYGGYRLITVITDNSVSVVVTETIMLPAESTDSFTSLSVEVEGDVMMTTNMLDRCEFLMKLNTGGRGGGGAAGVSGSFTNGSPLGGGRRLGGGGGGGSVGGNSTAGSRIALHDIVLNDMVDAEFMAATGNLQFMPPCVGLTPLLKYKASLAEDFMQPVTLKNCVVQPASVPGATRITFDLLVNAPILEGSVSLMFPKNSRVVNVSTQKVGEWHFTGPSEMIWSFGPVTLRGGSSGSTGVSARMPPATDVDSPAAQGSGVRDSGAFLDASTTFRAGEGQSGLANLGALDRLLVVAVEITYVITITDGEGDAENDAQSAHGRGAARRERRRKQDEMREAVVPGMCLAYSTNCTASGLQLRKLQTLSSQRNATWWGAPIASTAAAAAPSAAASDPASPLGPATGGRKVSKRVKYVTRYAQQIQPELQM